MSNRVASVLTICVALAALQPGAFAGERLQRIHAAWNALMGRPAEKNAVRPQHFVSEPLRSASRTPPISPAESVARVRMLHSQLSDRGTLSRSSVQGNELVLEDALVGSTRALPESATLLDHARSLPASVQRKFVNHFREVNPASRARSIDDLIRSGLLMPSTIRRSFAFFTEARVDLASAANRDSIVNVVLNIRNGGTNTNSTMRPGASADWIELAAGHLASRLRASGATVNTTEILDGRNFKITLRLPANQLIELQQVLGAE